MKKSRFETLNSRTLWSLMKAFIFINAILHKLLLCQSVSTGSIAYFEKSQLRNANLPEYPKFRFLVFLKIRTGPSYMFRTALLLDWLVASHAFIMQS